VIARRAIPPWSGAAPFEETQRWIREKHPRGQCFVARREDRCEGERIRISTSRVFVGWILQLDRLLGLKLYTTPSSYIFPHKLQVENCDDLTGAVYEAEKPNRLIVEYCAAREVRCLDLLPVLTEEHARTGE
jgi:hypothetical protein